MSSQLQVSGEAKIRTIQGPVVANSGVITALDGDASQYVRGDGTLADFPTSTGGGSSVSYYLNSSVSQGTIGGVAYRELSKDPISGAGTDITISANGYVASYITDANDPALLEVPAGNFNCEFYFSVNSNSHNPYVYAELYKYDGTTFTLLGSNQAIPEYLTNGTTLSAYYFAIPVAVAALTITDRIAIRIYVNVDGRTVTLHTENNHLCQVVTTFSKGLTSLNNLTRQVQFFGTGTSGTDFNISSVTATHTFNIPSASATNRGLITTGTQTIAGDKTFSGSIILNGGVDINNSLNVNSGFFIRNNVIGSTLYTSFTITKASNIETISYLFSTGFASNLLFNDSASYSYSFPTASGTVALLESTQTFSGVNTFSLDISVNSLTIGRGAGAIASNTVVGASALPVNTTGTLNTAIGNFSLLTNTTGYGNTSVGHSALAYNTTGFFNAAIGINALLSNTTGTYNNALGTASLYNNTTGSNNTAVGQVSGTNNTTGSNNTYIGFGSGGGITTGSNNTIIGQFTGTAAMANNIVLADGAGNVRYQWNGTNNVFGNPISGTSSTFSSSVTASSLVKSGGTSSQFLMADGSVNTSVLPSGAYLPLAGGTLTGALSGTSATFSAGLVSQGAFTGFQYNSAGAYPAYNTYFGAIGTNFSNSNSELDIWNTVGGGFVFRRQTGASAQTALLTIASTGAATFSSSVNIGTAGSEKLNIFGAGSQFINVKNTTTNADMFVGMSSALSAAFIGTGGTDPIVFSTAGSEKVRITSGGNVGIGTSSPTAISGFTSVCVNNATSGGFFEAQQGGTVLSRYGAQNDISFIDTVANIPFIIKTNSTERMRITSGGAVNIGMTSNDYARLAVKSNSTNNYAGFNVYSPNNNNFTALNHDGSIGWLTTEFATGGGFTPLAFAVGGSERMRITSGGVVLVNSTTSPNANHIMYVNGSNLVMGVNASVGGSAENMRFYNAGTAVGTISTTGSATSYNTSSDYRLKQDFKDYDALSLISAIKTYDYEWKTDKSRMFGVVAHELAEVIPYAVHGKKDAEEMQGVDYSKLVPILIKSIQEQQAQIEELKELIKNK